MALIISIKPYFFPIVAAWTNKSRLVVFSSITVTILIVANLICDVTLGLNFNTHDYVKSHFI